MSVSSVGYIPVSPMPLPVDLRMQIPRQNETITQPETKVNQQVIQSTAADLQKISQAFDKRLKFVVDQKSNQVIVKVIDKETDKVIKELPPEELQRLHRNLKEAIGLLFNEMV